MTIGWYALWGLSVDGETVRGLPTHLRYLRYLLDQTAGVRLFTNVVSSPAEGAASLTDPRLRVVPLPGASFASMWRQLGAVRSTFDAHLDGVDGMVARLFDPCPWLLDGLCRRRRIPLLLHMVGNPIDGIFLRDDWNVGQKWARRLAFWPEEYLSVRAARRNRWVVNGSRLADTYARGDRRADVVITSTLEPEDFRPVERDATGPLTVAFVGFLRRPKRVEMLLRALAAVTPPARGLRLRIVGGPLDSTYHDELQRAVHSLGLSERVSFGGHIPLGPALTAELTGADVFAFPSATEGSPRVLLEAAAAGLPIVSTDVGGVSDVFTDQKNILLAPVDDQSAFTAQLARLIDDAALRRRLAVAGQEVARAHQGPDFMRTLLDHLRPPGVAREEVMAGGA